MRGPYTPGELSLLPGFSIRSLVCPEDLAGSRGADWREVRSVPELAAAAGMPAGPGLAEDADLRASLRGALAGLLDLVTGLLARRRGPASAPPEPPPPAAPEPAPEPIPVAIVPEPPPPPEPVPAAVVPEPALPAPEPAAAAPAPEPEPPLPVPEPQLPTPVPEPPAPEPLPPVVQTPVKFAPPRWRKAAVPAAAAALCAVLLVWALTRKPSATQGPPATAPAAVPAVIPAQDCPPAPAPCPGPEAWNQDALDDRELDAIHLVRNCPAKGLTGSVGRTLDRKTARTGRFAPWTAARLSEDAFKVGFILPSRSGKQTFYEFEADLSRKKVTGRSAAAKSLLR
ncbi:MAG: hypothetical protein A3J82_03705 [Elusimicrobia bacterium RIFOXYA2_FULL_69_6]|nr:MAG: hypothetical protein A3J82_03705 [Elusimicrobia bacterium RIFOXYA2_FULL_69_6]